MDVEKTMQFLLEQQVRFDARLEAWQEAQREQFEAHRSRIEAQQARSEAQQAESDRRYARIDRYIQRGARFLVRERAMRREIDQQISALIVAQQSTEQKLREVAEAHRQTEVSLQAFIDSMPKPSNGN